MVQSLHDTSPHRVVGHLQQDCCMLDTASNINIRWLRFIEKLTSGTWSAASIVEEQSDVALPGSKEDSSGGVQRRPEYLSALLSYLAEVLT